MNTNDIHGIFALLLLLVAYGPLKNDKFPRRVCLTMAILKGAIFVLNCWSELFAAPFHV